MEKFVWTEKAIATLRRLHAEDLSFAKIADEIGGGVTRNAVIGKAKRLGLPDRRLKETSGKRQPRKMRPKPRRPGMVRPPIVKVTPLPSPSPEPPDCDPISLMAAGFGQCRFPVRDFKGADEPFFCGAPSDVGHSYCAWHRKIAAGQGTSSERKALDTLRRAAA